MVTRSNVNEKTNFEKPNSLQVKKSFQFVTACRKCRRTQTARGGGGAAALALTVPPVQLEAPPDKRPGKDTAPPMQPEAFPRVAVAVARAVLATQPALADLALSAPPVASAPPVPPVQKVRFWPAIEAQTLADIPRILDC